MYGLTFGLNHIKVLLVNHKCTVKRFKPCEIEIEEQGSQGKGGEQRRQRLVHSSLESVERVQIELAMYDLFHEKFIAQTKPLSSGNSENSGGAT